MQKVACVVEPAGMHNSREDACAHDHNRLKSQSPAAAAASLASAASAVASGSSEVPQAAARSASFYTSRSVSWASRRSLVAAAALGSEVTGLRASRRGSRGADSV